MLASILIKSNDQRKYLAQTYEILARQTVEDFEIILLYSGKPGCTPLAPTDLACRIVRIIPEEFSHPGALNIGAKVAAGQYLVCLSADAVPASEEWLKSLLEPFDCPYVAGVFGRHLFRKEGNIIDRWKLWLRYPARSLCRWGQGNYIFSNANSAIRRTRWESRSFDEAVRECEDYEWMRWAHGSGSCTVYAADAAVYHTHGETYGYVDYLRRAMGFRSLRKHIDLSIGVRMCSTALVGPCVVIGADCTVGLRSQRYPHESTEAECLPRLAEECPGDCESLLDQ